MAYVTKRSDSPYWFACWHRPGSRVPIRRSTKIEAKAQTKKQAEELADLWHRFDAKEITAQRALQVIDELRGGGTGKVSIEAHCQRWLASHEKSWKPATFIFYAKCVSSFLKHLGSKKSLPISHLTRAHLIEWRDATAAKVSPKTTNNRLKGIRSVFKGALQDGLIDYNPADQVSVLKAVRGATTRGRFTEDQLRSVLAVAKNWGDWYGVTLMGAYTGLRLGDAVSLKWASIDLNEGLIFVTTEKTGARLVIPMAPALQRYFAARPDKEGFIHPVLEGIRQSSKGRTNALSNQFGDILAQAGLRPARDPNKRAAKDGRDGGRETNALSFHSLRHTANTFLYEAGVPDAVVRAIIGHSSASMSAHYTHIGKDALRDAASRMPDLTN